MRQIQLKLHLEVDRHRVEYWPVDPLCQSHGRAKHQCDTDAFHLILTVQCFSRKR